MMKTTLAIAAVALAIPWLAAAQDEFRTRLEASPRHQEWVVIPAEGGRQVKAFVVFPEISEKAHSIVVIHEIFGLTDWVRAVGDELAKNGYFAICPDLLSGMGPDGGATDSFPSVDQARRGVSELPPDQVIADLKAVVAYARGLDSTTDNVSVTGFCWGGGQSFNLALHEPSLTASFPFYGTPRAEAADYAKISCPVYGFYGENDNRVNATIDGTKAAMAAAGKTYEPVIYAGARHGFLRVGMSSDSDEANKKAAEDAWKRLLALMAEVNK